HAVAVPDARSDVAAVHGGVDFFGLAAGEEQLAVGFEVAVPGHEIFIAHGRIESPELRIRHGVEIGAEVDAGFGAFLEGRFGFEIPFGFGHRVSSVCHPGRSEAEGRDPLLIPDKPMSWSRTAAARLPG